MIVELVGGPLDGDRVEVDEDAFQYVRRMGGERPRSRWVPGEGFPLLAKVGETVLVYRIHADADARSARTGGPRVMVYDERSSEVSA